MGVGIECGVFCAWFVVAGRRDVHAVLPHGLRTNAHRSMHSHAEKGTRTASGCTARCMRHRGVCWCMVRR